MKRIFESRSFSQYRSRTTRFDESARGRIYNNIGKITVFLSHKHNELEDMQDIICFLQSKYGVLVYIDSQDSSMPSTTSGATAKKLKERIKNCDKFIFLATNGAIESTWCNWELGYGDAHKYKENIALFLIKPQLTHNSAYKGNEYMSIYPYITYSNGTELYSDGSRILKGYYVVEQTATDELLTPLASWLRK